MAKQIIKMYTHSSKEDNCDYAEDLEFENERAEETFLYSLYEVEFEVEVDLKTGYTKILKVDGRELK